MLGIGRPCNHTPETHNPIGCSFCRVAETSVAYAMKWDGVVSEYTEKLQQPMNTDTVIKEPFQPVERIDLGNIRLTKKQIIKSRLAKVPCVYLGDSLKETSKCVECGKHSKDIQVFSCNLLRKPCTVDGATKDNLHCLRCNEYIPATVRSSDGHMTTLVDDNKPLPNAPKGRKKVIWSYGITTTPIRRKDLLPRTIMSLRKAGFGEPRLFVDGCSNAMAVSYEAEFKLEVVSHWPNLLTFGNWMLALWELYLRSTGAHRYAIFQDDLVALPNLRPYLEAVEYPNNGYLNLYTFPENQRDVKAGSAATGWYKSNQRGLGAVALVFNNEAVRSLLGSRYMSDRPTDAHRGTRAIDGGIVSAFQKMEPKWYEYCHTPSLVQHTGIVSSMRNGLQPLAPSFPGEDFDAMRLLPSS